MKKSRLLVASLMMAIPALNGCSLLGDSSILSFLDPLNFFHKEKVIYPSIMIDGELNKKNYAFNDEWDLSGLVFKTKDADGKITTLSSGQYEVTATPAKPRGFFGSLSLKVKVSGYPSIKQIIPGVSVTQEVVNTSQEISEYYSGLSSQPTLEQLQEHSFQKHTTWITYGKVTDYYHVSDEHRSVDEIPGHYKNEAFYTGKEIDFSDRPTKEHVWACNDTNGLYSHSGSGSSYVDDPNYVGAGSDLLQIRPCVGTVNTARGDCTFTELGTKGTYIKDEGDKYGFRASKTGVSDGEPITFATYGEPDNEMKGDLARILAYVYMHYSTSVGNYGGDKCGGLVLSNVLKIPNNKYASLNKMLVAWNQIDPVSEVEKYRNHTVEQIQGNRNPFVDHPEWLNTLFNN